MPAPAVIAVTDQQVTQRSSYDVPDLAAQTLSRGLDIGYHHVRSLSARAICSRADQLDRRLLHDVATRRSAPERVARAINVLRGMAASGMS